VDIKHFDINFFSDGVKRKAHGTKFKPETAKFPLIRVVVEKKDGLPEYVLTYYEKGPGNFFFFDLPGKKQQALAENVKSKLAGALKKVA